MPAEVKIYTYNLDNIEDIDPGVIGLYSQYLHTIAQLKIDIPKTFVVTTDAFEDFLIANDMVTEIHAWLKTVNGSDMDDIYKASQNISHLFETAVMPASIFEAIRDAYASFSHHEETMVDISLSWIPELKNLTGGNSNKYSFQGVCGMNELEKLVKEAWQAPFDAKTMFERMQQGYGGNISVALVIKKTVAAEVSGKIYSYNPLTNNQNQQEIQAVLGLWRGVDELGIVPDHYVINKQNESIEEKNVMTQATMLLKKGFIKNENDERYIKVGISKAWQIRQKVSEKILQDLAVITNTLEEKFAQSIELDWALEAGKIYISAIKFLPRVRHQNSLSFNPNIISKEDYKVVNKPLKVELITDKDLKKSLDEYVEEIESEISSLDGIGWDESGETGKLAKRVKHTPKAKKIEESMADESDIKPLELKLYEDIDYQFLYKEKFETVTKVYIDISKTDKLKNFNSGAFDGVIGIKGNDIVRGYGINLAKADAHQLEGFIDYGVREIMNLIERDKQKDYIYTLSNLDLNEAMRFVSVNASGVGLHLNSAILIELELEIIRIIRNKKNFRRLWLNVQSINQLSDFKYFKNIIDNHTLKKSPSFRFFMEIDLIPPFINIFDYLDETLDGIIVELDAILKQIIGSKVTESSIMKNTLFWTMMDNISNATEKRKIPLILRSRLLSESDAFVQKLLKYGVFGITINPEQLLEMRSKLHRLELKNLG